MTVFLAVTAGLTGAYVYDRSECKRLQQDYIDKVRWMREQTLESDELARRIKVYGARVPEDGELERSSKWFKRYMRVSLRAVALPRGAEADASILLSTLSPSLLHQEPITFSKREPIPVDSVAH